MTRQFLIRCVGFSATLGVICGGCIIIPTDFHAYYSRTNVREETTTTINAGHTTKEDVFLALGEPDAVSPDGGELVYRWTKEKAIVVAGCRDRSINKEYNLIITFDERSVVKHREVQSRWLSE